MSDILSEHVEADDRMGYYTQLEEWGYRYASLALDVVTSETLSGRVANSYFLNQASDEGVTISAADLSRISLRLMEEDWQIRQQTGLALEVNDIQTYHTKVFREFEVSANGWTPNFAIEALPKGPERDAFWANLLATDSPLYSTEVLFSTIGPASTASQEANEWRSEVASAGFRSFWTSSNSFGPYEVPLEGGGRMIGDGVGNSIIVGAGNNDVLMGFIGADDLIGRGGDDRLWGGPGRDFLHGGEGDDILNGGDGPDILYDNGGDEPDPSESEVYEYDDGNDTLDGGDGSDILVYSGGTDEFRGGTGNDTYIVSPDFLENQTDDDRLTIYLSEESAAEDTWFGHDYVLGNGAGIYEIIFEDMDRDDVTFTYEYEQTPFEELDLETQTQFINRLGVETLDLGTYPIFSLSGQLAITVNATGSSIYFENVGGAYVGGDNSINGNLFFEPILFTQTYAVFEDGTYFDWAQELEIINFIEFQNGTITDEADDAPETQSDEAEQELANDGPSDIPRLLIVSDVNEDTTTGTGGNDAIYGTNEDEVLLGLAGNDLLSGGSGADTLNGGSGVDIADYSSSDSGVSVNLRSGTASGGDAEGDVLISIEGLTGSNFDDALTGDNESGTTYIEGLAGDDVIYTGNGNFDSFLLGGAGNDTLIVRDGNSSLEGGEGDDDLYGHTGIDILRGGSGNDTLTLNTGDDIYDGGDGYDILTSEFIGPSAARYVNLQSGEARELYSADAAIGIGSNQVSGIEGYVGGAGRDYVIGTDGANLLDGGRGNDTLEGGEGDDTLEGGFNDDLLIGGAGDDSIIADFGDDIVHGGIGTDTVYYSAQFSEFLFSTQAQTLYITYVDGSVDQVENDVEFISFEDGVHSWSDLSAVLSNDVPVANDDAVSITEGNSLEINPLANDTDGNGDELAITEINGSAVNEGSTIFAGPGLDLTISVTSNGSLLLTAANPFGNGLADNETFDIVISYTVADGLGGFDQADINLTVVGATEVGNVVVGSSGNDVIDSSFVDVEGNGLTDLGQTITGLGGNDQIYDGAGDDFVSGGDDRDRFYAGAGADTYDGGDDRDEVFYTTSTIGVTVNMLDSSASTGIAAGDTFIDVEYLHGSDHDDVLVSIAERTFGRAGDDTLEDGAGVQLFYGGSGNDTFRFTDDGGQQDRINDFTLGGDVLDLSVWGVTGLEDPDLTIVEQTNGQGNPQGRLLISYNGDSIRLDGLNTADIATLESDLSHFIFAGGSSGGGGTFAGATIDGTSANDIIDGNYVDADGEAVSEGGQTILGGDGNDHIYDGSGDDLVSGGNGRDRFFAGDGADAYDGGSDRDEVFYSTATSGLTIDMTDAANSTGIAAGDIFTDIEYLHGSDFDDVIIADAERVFARNGDDVLQDGSGEQRFFGGAGSDTFRFSLDGGQQDRISDFVVGEDILDLSLWGVTGLDDAGLTIEEETNGQGNLQDRVIITYNGDSIRIDNMDTADIVALELDPNAFIFA